MQPSKHCGKRVPQTHVSQNYDGKGAVPSHNMKAENQWQQVSACFGDFFCPTNALTKATMQKPVD